MKQKLLCISLLFFAIETSYAQYDFHKLDSVFSHSSFAGKDGYSVILFNKSGNIFEKNTGDFRPDKQVPIASASKWPAAAVIMRLVEKGSFKLDDPISKYIPSFNTPDKKSITIRQCFSHTSGLPGGQEAFDEFMGKRLKSYEKITNDIAGVDMVSLPGKQFNYGGMGMQVAGRVAELVTGKNWHTLFKEELTDPLEMKETHYAGYRLNIVPRIAGGVLSTANDYLHFLQMIFEKGRYKGKQFLSAASVEIMLQDQTNSAETGYSPYNKYTVAGSQRAAYGIGNWLLNVWDANLNTSPGAFGFTPWIDRKKGYYGVIAVRSSFQKVMPVFVDAVRMINGTL